ncbi:MAG: hypothetical protein J6Z11_04545, partial [Candidatus Riflebacteria bacterium]|nr:hypothetical protein [Candidatus Riflebacteria bacterium]
NDYTMIGVSYFVYVQADKSMIIKKEKNSPVIYLNNEKFIDKGLVWGIISILGMIISFLIYKQTLIKLPNEDSNKTDEEIAI